MIGDLRQHLERGLPFLEGKRLLLAVSGGLDSMVMASLMIDLGYTVGIAHCNFGLRGGESDKDEDFVRSFASVHRIEFFTTRFDTKAFAADFSLSVQMAARRLRYEWFSELLQQHRFDYVLTAHQANDRLETFLINLSRGTGIDGLTGIPEHSGTIVRPLLPFSREQIEAYALKNHISWREDSSNASHDYLRNALRHEVIKPLLQLRPDFLDRLTDTQHHLAGVRSLADDAARLVFAQLAKTDGTTVSIDLAGLLRLPNYRAYLYQWLKDYGFGAWDDVYGLVTAQSGKQVFSEGFVLLKDRGSLLLSPIGTQSDSPEFLVYKGMEQLSVPLNISLKFCEAAGKNSNTAIFVDAGKLEFPLRIRKWRQGDVFFPSGMQGRSKKVGKFFKDEKMSLRQKEEAWLLCSGERIVWIIGKRADDRFKTETTSTDILNIQLNA